MDVVVYTTPTCPYCYQVKEFLARQGVRYVERDVSIDRAAATEMVAKTGQRGVPVITIDGEVVVGFDRGRLTQILQAKQPGTFKRPSLGISVADASSVLKNGRPIAEGGAYVGRVSPGTAGERLGLQPDDVIIEINGWPIRAAGDVEAAISSATEGTQLSVSFNRNGRRMNVQARL